MEKYDKDGNGTNSRNKISIVKYTSSLRESNSTRAHYRTQDVMDLAKSHLSRDGNLYDVESGRGCFEYFGCDVYLSLAHHGPHAKIISIQNGSEETVEAAAIKLGLKKGRKFEGLKNLIKNNLP